MKATAEKPKASRRWLRCNKDDPQRSMVFSLEESFKRGSYQRRTKVPFKRFSVRQFTIMQPVNHGAASASLVVNGEVVAKAWSDKNGYTQMIIDPPQVFSRKSLCILVDVASAADMSIFAHVERVGQER